MRPAARDLPHFQAVWWDAFLTGNGARSEPRQGANSTPARAFLSSLFTWEAMCD